MLGGPFVGLGLGAVIDRDVMPLGLKVARHRVAHDAETDKGAFRHSYSPSCVR